ncbi:MAG: FIG000605: protein co-occurring with transport systems (COG1739) [uncultured Sulfurovum sp.]|uniref:FIG000605: protein co-occurring with transport systems (COG1739) n=1 Tax=uncultured Sulfurovum sp. TaxID=269237 RepID=A0A6S6SL42_9BACT|nr:MAG: FIG000605: protein co-occurring with transport systems (COG1739) [uncultured Sulfurovum sp.]
MQTIEESFVGKYEVKKSKFIAHLVPIAQYKGLQEKLKAEHPKARHVVYALRYLNEFDQIVENSSDDEEPKGAAGVPSLNVLRGKELINVAVLTVRYFGGTKLGIGGMARAYASAVKEVVSVADIKKYEKEFSYEFHSSYSDVQKSEYLLNKLEIFQVNREFLGDKVAWKIRSTEEKINKFKEEICKK